MTVVSIWAVLGTTLPPRCAPNPLAAHTKLEDNRKMTDFSFSLPDELSGPLKSRLADGSYADAAEYFRELVRGDLAEAAEDTAWLGVKVEEGPASGVSDKTTQRLIENIITRRKSSRA